MDLSNDISSKAKVTKPKRLPYIKGTSFFILLQVMLLSGLSWVIYTKYQNFIPNGLMLKEFFDKPKVFLVVILVVFLGVLNYTLETLKWLSLVPFKVEKRIVFVKALLSGCTVSVFLPYRTGEYLGRIIHFKKRHWAEIIVSSIRAGLLQLTVTLLMGGLAAMIVLAQLKNYFSFNTFTIFLVLVLLLLMVIVFIVKIETIVNWGMAKLKLHLYPNIRIKSFVRPFILAGLRYLVFTTQYVILLHFFGVMDLAQGIFWVPVFLLIQTLIPTMFLSELGLRVVLSAYLFGATEAVVPVFLIYIINIILPALAGVFFIKKWS